MSCLFKSAASNDGANILPSELRESIDKELCAEEICVSLLITN